MAPKSSNDEVYQKRDLLLTEIHTEVLNIKDKIGEQKEALADHEAEDKEFQKKVLWIGVAVLVIVSANGGLSAIKLLFHA